MCGGGPAFRRRHSISLPRPMPSCRRSKLERRDAIWAIKAPAGRAACHCLRLLRSGSRRSIAEQQEPEVELRQMTDGHNVVQDYGHVGLTLREHPLAFLRRDLQERNIVTCSEAMNCPRRPLADDGRASSWCRQKPGSAKGVMFMTIEDETGPGQCGRLADACSSSDAARSFSDPR